MFCGSSELPYSSYLHYIQLLDSIEFVEHNNSISLSKNIPSCHQIDDDETEDEKQFSDSADLCFEVGDFSNPLEVLSDIEFLNCYHLSKKTVIDVMDLIKHGLVKYSNRGSPVPPLIALLITLQYFAEGSMHKKSIHKVSQSTTSRIICKVSELIAALHKQFIKLPDKNSVESIKMKFLERRRFPEVVGCVGTMHVGIRLKTSKPYHHFLNEEGFHSLKVQIISDSDLNILEVISNCTGSTHSNKIFERCEMNKKLTNGELQGVVLGNLEYNPGMHLMCGVKQPQHAAEHYYSDALNKTYNADECIMKLKKRFPCLQTYLACKSHTQQNIIMSCAILHNIANRNGDLLSFADEHSNITNLKGRKHFVKKHFDSIPVDNMALIAREEFIRKHFFMYYGSPSLSYLSL